MTKPGKAADGIARPEVDLKRPAGQWFDMRGLRQVFEHPRLPQGLPHHGRRGKWFEENHTEGVAFEYMRFSNEPHWSQDRLRDARNLGARNSLAGGIALAARQSQRYEAPRLRVSNSKLTRIAVQAAKAAKDIKRTVVSMGNLQLDDSQLSKL
jgi:hypothetical protein